VGRERSLTIALAVAATVAAVEAVVSYRGTPTSWCARTPESGPTARPVPFTVDDLIWAASMLILEANRCHQPVPPLARRCLGAGIGANLAHELPPRLRVTPSNSRSPAYYARP